MALISTDRNLVTLATYAPRVIACSHGYHGPRGHYYDNPYRYSYYANRYRYALAAIRGKEVSAWIAL